MKYGELVEHFKAIPVIESQMLKTFGQDPKKLSVQLDRWCKSGKLIRLKKGLYMLPKHLRQVTALEHVANLMYRPSYVSLERALALHGLIPERVDVVQSICVKRPIRFSNQLGTFEYRHVKQGWFFGYLLTNLAQGEALVARPEKALLDIWYLNSGEWSVERIEQQRLQHLEILDFEVLLQWAINHPRLLRAVKRLIRFKKHQDDWEIL
jgi:predicted transcriptional regulator of viral defense system